MIRNDITIQFMQIIFTVLFIITALFACNNDSKIIIGKWRNYNIPDTRYMEFDIFSDSIGAFSSIVHNISLVPYKYINDTIYYNGMNVHVKILNRNKIVLFYKGESDTLIRLNDTIQTYHRLKVKNEKNFQNFYNKFLIRVHESWIKYGYVTKEELNKPLPKEYEVEEYEIITK